MKPTRPSVRFPNYKQLAEEASSTVVEQSPWVGDGEASVTALQAAPPARPSIAVPRPGLVSNPPASKAPLSPKSAVFKPLFKPASKPAPKVLAAEAAPVAPTMPSFVPPPPADLVALVQPPPPVAMDAVAAFVPRPPPAPAPAWALPAVPEVSMVVPERKEQPSYGPVAFDLEPALGSSRATRSFELPVQSKRNTIAILSAVAALAVFGSLAGRFAHGVIASSGEPTQVVAAVAAPELPAAVVTPVEAPPAPALRRLTPQEIFPVAAPTVAPKRAPQSRADREHEKRQRQLMAADIARRNAPTMIVATPRGLRPASPPEVDDLLRTPRLRGERD